MNTTVTDNPLRGIGLMVLSTIFFSMSDTMAKFLTHGVPVIEIAWVRYAVFVVFALGLAVRPGMSSIATRRPGLQLLRGLCIVGSAVFFILSLHDLPMAEAATINFVSPLMITVLAVVVLGEIVTRTGWLLLAMGFAGVLITARPGTTGFHPAVIWVVLSSACWAVGMMATRQLAGTERPTTTLVWTAGSGFGVLSACLPFVATVPEWTELGLMIALGFIASTGQYLSILAYRHAGAAVLAPLSYGQLIWSTSFGFLVFGNVPDQWTILGALVIIASGLIAIQAQRSARPRRRITARVA